MGDKTTPAIPAASTTTLILVIGLGLSKIFPPEMLLATPSVGSGILRIAERHDLVHVSIVFSKIP
jgi:hypothetical protein